MQARSEELAGHMHVDPGSSAAPQLAVGRSDQQTLAPEWGDRTGCADSGVTPLETGSADAAHGTTHGERERLADPQAGAPEDGDQSTSPVAVAAGSRSAHHEDDLLDRG
jgi:hypothetical protein